MHQITPLLFADLSESCPISCPSIQDDGESCSLLTVDSKLNMFDSTPLRFEILLAIFDLKLRL